MKVRYESLVEEVDDMYVKINVKNDPLYKRGYLEGLTVVRKKWIEKGMKKGIEKGFEKGLITEAQQSVLDVLEERFGIVDEEIKRKLKLINNRAKLRWLHRLSIKCKTFDEFKKVLKKFIRQKSVNSD